MDKLDKLLYSALSPAHEPDARLRGRVLGAISKEPDTVSDRTLVDYGIGSERIFVNDKLAFIKEDKMDKITAFSQRRKRLQATAAAAAAVFALSGVTAFAAIRLLSAGAIAKRVGDKALTEAFESGGAVDVGETQTFDDFDVTLIGVISGENISDYIPEYDGEALAGRTYAAAAVRRNDGRSMSDGHKGFSHSFFVSPYIQGLDPKKYNAYVMEGGYSAFVEDGVLYYIGETRNIEIFADKKIYLGVSEGTFPDKDAYIFDETTGLISRNLSYEGVNALFELPIDGSKADEKKAEEFLRLIDKRLAGEDDEGSLSDDDGSMGDVCAAFMERVDVSNIGDLCEPIEMTRAVYTPDKDGWYFPEWELPGGAGGRVSANIKTMFQDGKTGMSDKFSWSGGETLDELFIEVHTLNEDGTVDFVIYTPRAGE